MVFGLVRVSTVHKNLEIQIDAFVKVDVESKNVYTDKILIIIGDIKSLSRLLKYQLE